MRLHSEYCAGIHPERASAKRLPTNTTAVIMSAGASPPRREKAEDDKRANKPVEEDNDEDEYEEDDDEVAARWPEGGGRTAVLPLSLMKHLLIPAGSASDHVIDFFLYEQD
jgi:hypothetical protein